MRQLIGLLAMTAVLVTGCGGQGAVPVVPVDLNDLITKPLFSTGSGPNDMVFGNSSLYVANSLDNTVTRYAPAGAVLATYAMGEFASPSYLALGNDALWVAANGANTISVLDPSGLTVLQADSPIRMEIAGFAFPGPGSLAVSGSFDSGAGAHIFLPMAMIEAFADATTYAAGSLYWDTFRQAPQSPNIPGDPARSLSGFNGQCAVYDAENGRLLVSSAGQVQFDELWQPFVTTNSYLDIFELDGGEVNLLASTDLGPVGAGRIALSSGASHAYLGNQLNGNVYKIDLRTYSVVRGLANPIVLTEDFTYVADLAFTPDGKYLLATSFNTDELYVIDPATDAVSPEPYTTPFDLSLDPELMAGCANVEIAPDPDRPGKYAAYVLYGVANAVAKVDLL